LVNRLPIITSVNGREKLPDVSVLNSGTGCKQALCTNTIASNKGHLNGACDLLKKLLECNIIYKLCRHHIYEIILKRV